MKPGISIHLDIIESDVNTWKPNFPNSADFRFSYFKLLKASPRGLATIPTKKKIAVIGAGAAGMTAARELYRCGFDVTIFESSDRIGGRLFTIIIQTVSTKPD